MQYFCENLQTQGGIMAVSLLHFPPPAYILFLTPCLGLVLPPSSVCRHILIKEEKYFPLSFHCSLLVHFVDPHTLGIKISQYKRNWWKEEKTGKFFIHFWIQFHKNIREAIPNQVNGPSNPTPGDMLAKTYMPSGSPPTPEAYSLLPSKHQEHRTSLPQTSYSIYTLWLIATDGPPYVYLNPSCSCL